MYETHFGFHRQPFQASDAGSAFFVSESIRRLLPQLLHAMRTNLGIAVLTGPAGSGKTALLRHLRQLLSSDGRAVVCSAAGLESPIELLETLYTTAQRRAGNATAGDSSPSDAAATAFSGGRISRWSVTERLRRSTELWGPALLLIDDAQLLSVSVLNELRAFTEDLSSGTQLVRCLIAGPLSLEEELARPTHADFSRRIRCHVFLQPLTMRESVAYLQQQLEFVGGCASQIFSTQALDAISIASDGSPRCINLLADETLVLAQERGLTTADITCVNDALKRLQHLPYAWNISVSQDDPDENTLDEEESDLDDDVSASSVAASRTDPKLATASETSRSTPAITAASRSGVYEFSAPGVIEIGSASPIDGPKQNVLSGQQTNTTSTETTSAASTPSQPPDLSHLDGDHRDSSSIAHRPITATSHVAFEVGRRFAPATSSEGDSDVIELDELDNPLAAEMTSAIELVELSSHAGPSSTDRDLLGEDLNDCDLNELREHAATIDPAISDFGDDEPTADLHTADLNTWVSQLVPTMSQKSALEDPDTESNQRRQAGRLMNAVELAPAGPLPVFDRYTWLTLGRDVPTGHSTPIVTRSFSLLAEDLNPSCVVSKWPAAESVPVFSTTDAAIQRLLTSAVSHRSSVHVLPPISQAVPSSNRPPGRLLWDEVDADIESEAECHLNFRSGDACLAVSPSTESPLPSSDNPAVAAVQPDSDNQITGEPAEETDDKLSQDIPGPEATETVSIPMRTSRGHNEAPFARLPPDSVDETESEGSGCFTLPMLPERTDVGDRFRPRESDEGFPLAASVAKLQADIEQFHRGAGSDSPTAELASQSEQADLKPSSPSATLPPTNGSGNVPNSTVADDGKWRPGSLLQQATEKLSANFAVEPAAGNQLSKSSATATDAHDLNQSERPVTGHAADPNPETGADDPESRQSDSARFAKLFTKLRNVRKRPEL